ncbi:hypothetical protein H2248_010433 [Termitomyces sp. 'cryptogamus']|nr:hypothetical protein H2248_010433 [Termitomyces sp. 'cryptogamus']
MASKAAHKRLTKEYVSMQREPPPFVWAVPDEKNILTWNYIIRGPPDSPYAGGEYHGVLLFPSEYPFKPPGIKMYTPSGRFHPDRKICFSMSDFHPGTWNPAWSVATILTGLLSFMLSDEMTTGSVNSDDQLKRTLASRSHAWNLTQQRFKDCFPDFCTSHPRDLPNMGQKERGKPEVPSTAPPDSSNVTLGLAPTTPAATPLTLVQPSPATLTASTTGKLDDSRKTGPSLAATWGHLLSEKWRWGLLIAVAVLVSRLSSRT